MTINLSSQWLSIVSDTSIEYSIYLQVEEDQYLWFEYSRASMDTSCCFFSVWNGLWTNVDSICNVIATMWCGPCISHFDISWYHYHQPKRTTYFPRLAGGFPFSSVATVAGKSKRTRGSELGKSCINEGLSIAVIDYRRIVILLVFGNTHTDRKGPI